MEAGRSMVPPEAWSKGWDSPGQDSRGARLASSPAPAVGVTKSQGRSSLQAGNCSGQDQSPTRCPQEPHPWPVSLPTNVTAHSVTFTPLNSCLGVVGHEIDSADSPSETQPLARDHL